MLKTTWEYSLETEALRLLHTAHQISVGFYKVNNFIVLPYGPDYKDTSIVTFPDLPYHKTHRFWDRVKVVDITQIPVKAPQKLIEAVKNLLSEADIPKPYYQETQNLWEKAQEEVIAKIEKIMPDKKNAIKSITIYPTSFGTNTSFNRPSKYPADIFLYLRTGNDIYTITEAIVTALTRNDVFNDLQGIWQESELLVDWLVTHSAIAKVLKKYQPTSSYSPTIKYTRVKQRANLVERSKQFYQKLGVPSFENTFRLEEDKPTILGNPVENLTQREKEILALMIRKGSQLTTVDELAQILFKEDEEAFSLQAIAKQIQRLRDKLEANGVSGSFIQTKRGQGYMLVN